VTRRFDAVIVGGGIIGAGIAFALARRGMRDILVCEQGRVPGLGATTRSGGLVRMHHTARCEIDLAAAGLRTFQRWAEVVGGDCGYRPTGFAVLTDPRHEDSVDANVAAVVGAGGRSYRLTPARLAELHPALRVDGSVIVAYEPDGGYVDPATATTALLAASGVRVYEGVGVEAVITDGDRVSGVQTTFGPVSADSVILAGGAWTAKLAGSAGIDAPVTPRRIGIARAATGLGAGATCVVIDDTTGAYFRPAEAGSVYFGVPSAPDVDPHSHPAPLTEQEITAAVAVTSGRMPALAGAPVEGARAGLDGYTPDKRPIIGPAGPDGCYLAVGFSGGGVKMAPAVGELVAAEVTGAGAQELLEPFRLDRFPAAPIISEHPYDRI